MVLHPSAGHMLGQNTLRCRRFNLSTFVLFLKLPYNTSSPYARHCLIHNLPRLSRHRSINNRDYLWQIGSTCEASPKFNGDHKIKAWVLIQHSHFFFTCTWIENQEGAGQSIKVLVSHLALYSQIILVFSKSKNVMKSEFQGWLNFANF